MIHPTIKTFIISNSTIFARISPHFMQINHGFLFKALKRPKIAFISPSLSLNKEMIAKKSSQSQVPFTFGKNFTEKSVERNTIFICIKF